MQVREEVVLAGPVDRHQDCRPGKAEQVIELRDPDPGVDRGQPGADSRAAERDLKPLDTVGRQQRDRVAGSHPGARERGSHPRGATQPFAVGPAPRVRDYGLVPGQQGRSFGQQAEQVPARPPRGDAAARFHREHLSRHSNVRDLGFILDTTNSDVACICRRGQGRCGNNCLRGGFRYRTTARVVNSALPYDRGAVGVLVREDGREFKTDQADQFSRVFDVLELLVGHPDGMTVTEVSKRLDLPTSSTHNLLQRMVGTTWSW